MKITSVETIALRDDSDGTVISWNPSFSESDGVPASTGGYDITLVRVNTDEGVSGIGQCEAPRLVKALMSVNLHLIGKVPVSVVHGGVSGIDPWHSNRVRHVRIP